MRRLLQLRQAVGKPVHEADETPVPVAARRGVRRGKHHGYCDRLDFLALRYQFRIIRVFEVGRQIQIFKRTRILHREQLESFRPH